MTEPVSKTQDDSGFCATLGEIAENSMNSTTCLIPAGVGGILAANGGGGSILGPIIGGLSAPNIYASCTDTNKEQIETACKNLGTDLEKNGVISTSLDTLKNVGESFYNLESDYKACIFTGAAGGTAIGVGSAPLVGPWIAGGAAILSYRSVKNGCNRIINYFAK